MPERKPKTVRRNLTKDIVVGLKPPRGARSYIYDAKQPGLALCITPAGTKTFYVYRKLNGRPERVRLGVWPQMNVGQARDAAADVVGKITTGVDPNVGRRIDRACPTFARMFEEFVLLPTRTKSKRPKSPKTVKDYRLQFDGYLKAWHPRKLSTVKRTEIERLHNQLAGASGQYTANRVLSLIKALYNSAKDLGYVRDNPASGIRAFEEQSRDRFLVESELPKFFAAVDAEPSEKVRDFVYLALYTGQRRGNVLAMRWVDLDLQRAVWTLPTTKTGRHQVPLIAQALEILRRREKDKGECEYVLPGRHGRGHLKDPMRQWREILERAGIEDLRVHDLRRSMGSWEAITGASLPTIGAGLGHSRPETTAIYSRLSDDPVRRAMQAAAAAMQAAGQTEGQENV